jgi:hypothetical protein
MFKKILILLILAAVVAALVKYFTGEAEVEV